MRRRARLGELRLLLDLAIVGLDALIEPAQLLEQIADRAAGKLRQRLGRLRGLAAHRHGAQRQHDAKLGHQPTQAVDDRRSLNNEPVAHPV
jgi:hypothetical protein